MKNKGISLIVLVITIIVIIILAGAVILTLTNNNIMGTANEAKIRSNFAAINEQVQLYNLNEIASNSEYSSNFLDADKSVASSNTNINAKNIYDIIPSIKNTEYSEKYR